MNTTKHCSTCGKPLATDTLLGLCPECMMKAGLPSSPKATIRVAADAFVEGSETETKEFVPGTKLGYIGDYELLEEIARGGMGVVYKARQSSLKRIVAIKMIRAGELAGETEIRRFHAEAEAAAQLQHPNIVAIHEIGEHEGRQYFSMDFIAGKNLAQFAAGKPVAPRLAAEWLKAITGAVQYAHQRGVLHRDLKPQNIMLDAERRPCVTDFGLAKNLAVDSSLTASGVVMGSPNYMSPEQARGLNDLVGPASDVYSLGAILYELLTGRPPFRGKSAMDTMSQVVNDEPAPPRSLNPDAPIDLESICLKCLEKDSARRYPTARELELDLGRFLAGEPVQAKPASALRKMISWFRRHRWVASAIVSVLMLTLAGLAYGFFEQTRFLIWHNANPSPVKMPVSQAKEFKEIVGWMLNTWRDWLPFLLAIKLIEFIWKKLIWKKLKTRPFGETIMSWLNSCKPSVVARHLGFGILGVGFGLFMTADAIHTFVWEGEHPSWIVSFFVLLMSWGGVGHLKLAMREQMQLPVAPRPEYQASPEFHATLIWIFWGLVTFLAGAWMWLAVPQPFSKTNLIPLVCGFAVVVSARFALFLFRQRSVAKSRWIGSIRRMGSLCLTLGILLIDFLFILLVLFTPNSNSSIPHGQGLFTCGLIFGGLLIFLLRKKLSPLPRLQATPTLAPSISLSPEQLAPIHEAIFAGRIDDAFKLYHAANGENPNRKISDYKNLLKLVAELKQSHLEKFSAKVLNREAKIAIRDAWLGWGLILFVGLWLLLLPDKSLAWLLWLFLGLIFGGFIRSMSANKMAGWKSAYREVRRGMKLAAWFVVACCALAVCAFAEILFGLIHHPLAPRNPEEVMMASFAVGSAVGWLLVHLWPKKPKES